MEKFTIKKNYDTNKTVVKHIDKNICLDSLIMIEYVIKNYNG